MVERLQSLLKGDEATEISTREIMEYFFNRLQSHDMKERDHAVKVITLQAATNTVYGCIFFYASGIHENWKNENFTRQIETD